MYLAQRHSEFATPQNYLVSNGVEAYEEVAALEEGSDHASLSSGYPI